MKGATDYIDVFDRSGIRKKGRLLIAPGRHARGFTLEVYVLSKEDGELDIPLPSTEQVRKFLENAVKVYGIVSGNPGWDEEYGWLHHGKWEEDFEWFVQELRYEKVMKEQNELIQMLVKQKAKQQKEEEFLKTYE